MLEEFISQQTDGAVPLFNNNTCPSHHANSFTEALMQINHGSDFVIFPKESISTELSIVGDLLKGANLNDDYIRWTISLDKSGEINGSYNIAGGRYSGPASKEEFYNQYLDVMSPALDEDKSLTLLKIITQSYLKIKDMADNLGISSKNFSLLIFNQDDPYEWHTDTVTDFDMIIPFSEPGTFFKDPANCQGVIFELKPNEAALFNENATHKTPEFENTRFLYKQHFNRNN